MSTPTYKPVATAITCRDDDPDAMVMLGAYRKLEAVNTALRAAMELLLIGYEGMGGHPENNCVKQARAALGKEAT